jgi:transcriptional regulator with XRE-family HTH domain
LADVFVRFGKKLREARLTAGVSQERLAELAGLHRTYVSSVERGRRNISIENIERLAEALGIEMAGLMPARVSKKPDDGQGTPPRRRPARS